MNRQRQIGTRGESAVVLALRRLGFPGAERRALHGVADLGDVTGCGPIVVQVKSGEAARKASDGDLGRWAEQTERQRRNAKADVGLLVVQRKGVGPLRADRWWAVLPSTVVNPWIPDVLLRTTLAEACLILRHLGHGQKPDADRDGAA